MNVRSIAQWHTEKWSRVYRPAVFQQGEEEVRAEAHAGMADDADLIAGHDRVLSE
jgi:hypothetical protein